LYEQILLHIWPPCNLIVLYLPNVKATNPLPGAIFNEGVMG
jgi:hypothetical protein